MNEVDIHWQLRHPSILQLYNYFEDENYVYLVMEVCKNGELYRYLLEDGARENDAKKLRRLSEAEARWILSQVVDGLIYLHSRGIIHRDLKLSNLLLTEEFDIVSDFCKLVNGWTDFVRFEMLSAPLR